MASSGNPIIDVVMADNMNQVRVLALRATSALRNVLPARRQPEIAFAALCGAIFGLAYIAGFTREQCVDAFDTFSKAAFEKREKEEPSS